MANTIVSHQIHDDVLQIVKSVHHCLLLVESLSQCIGITGQFRIGSFQGFCKCCDILVGSKQFLHLLQIGNLELHLSLLCQTTVTADEVLGS